MCKHPKRIGVLRIAARAAPAVARTSMFWLLYLQLPTPRAVQTMAPKIERLRCKPL